MPVPDIRALLHSERQSALDRVRTMTIELEGLAGDSDDANGDDEHDPEGSTLAYERARVGALLAESESHLRDVDRALAKVATGSYSACERCGVTISADRLEAVPATRTCFTCATARLPGPHTFPHQAGPIDEPRG